MTKLDWEKANLNTLPRRSIKDENEFLKKGYTARWLERAEQKQTATRKIKAASPRPRRCAPNYSAIAAVNARLRLGCKLGLVLLRGHRGLRILEPNL